MSSGAISSQRARVNVLKIGMEGTHVRGVVAFGESLALSQRRMVKLPIDRAVTGASHRLQVLTKKVVLLIQNPRAKIDRVV